MRITLSFILLLMCLSLGAIVDNAFPFIQISPSSISRAMGGGFIGVADVWHSSPFVAWDNPAVPAMHDGIGFGFMRDNHTDNSYYSEENYNSGMATIGYRGIGLSLPSLNPYGNVGTYFDLGDPTLEIVRTLNYNEKHIYNTALHYGISFDVMRYLETTKYQNPEKIPWMNVSIGLAYTEVTGNYSVIEDDFMYSMHKIKSHTTDLGIMAYAHRKLADKLVLEGSLGYKAFNLTDEYINYAEDNYPDPLGRNNIIGIGAGISIPKTESDGICPLLRVDNIATIRVLADKNYSETISETFSSGIEIGWLDTIYLRGGSFSNPDHNNKNFYSWGFGINLHNKGIWAIEYNFARQQNDPYIGYTNSWDTMVRVDGIKLVKTFIEKRSEK